MRERSAVTTFEAKIYIGFKKEGEEPLSLNETYVRQMLTRNICNDVGLCVTFAPTDFIYTNGNEPGAIIGLINYPRFPSTPEGIMAHAVEIGSQLMEKFNQKRVSIVCTDKTIMLSNE